MWKKKIQKEWELQICLVPVKQEDLLEYFKICERFGKIYQGMSDADVYCNPGGIGEPEKHPH